MYSTSSIQIKEDWLGRHTEARGDELDIETIHGKSLLAHLGDLGVDIVT